MVSRVVLDLDRFVPAALTQLGNKWSRGSSQIYLKRFGIGINEWRVLSLLAIETETTANRICSVIGMDKAAVGRSLELLHKSGYASFKSHDKDKRSKLVAPTKSGLGLHDKIIQIALKREKLLLENFSKNDIETLISLLNRMRANIIYLQAHDDGALNLD
jgi:DNA-binding MarR family transcriptional regulator